jgi:hypothetical protein
VPWSERKVGSTVRWSISERLERSEKQNADHQPASQPASETDGQN